MAQQRYGLYPCSFNNGGLSFTQLGSASFSANANKTEVFPAGQLYRRASITAHADPYWRIMTTDLLTAFGTPTVSPLAGYPCYSGNSIFYFQQRSDGASFLGSGNHSTATCAKGFLSPISISAQQDSPAVAEFGFWPLYDGSNEPVIFADDANLSGTPAWNSTYYLGPAYIDDAGTPFQLPTLIGMEVQFGIAFRPRRADGDVWARNGYIYQVPTQVTLTFENVGMLDSGAAKGDLPTAFGAFFGTGATNPGAMSLFLKRGSTTGAGQREVYTDADHCRIRIFNGEWTPDTVSVEEENDTTISVSIRPLYDGSNAQITIDATSAALAAWG